MIIRINTNKMQQLTVDQVKEIVNHIQSTYGIRTDVFNSAYMAVADEEATSSLDLNIINEDLFITSDQYDICVNQLRDEIYNSEDGFDELTQMANDMAREILRGNEVLVD